MSFVWRMAARETRASWRRLLFFFLCIAIGVGTIAALRSIVQNVRGVLASQARTLLAADLLVGTGRPWTPQARTIMDEEFARAGVRARTESVETPTMVRPADPGKAAARMVELRAVEPAFPLYGVLDLAGGRPYSYDRLRNHGALVRPELLTALGLRVGDALRIGTATFTIRGVIEHEPGRQVGGFSLGPRVLIASADLPSTGLLSFGSRARFQVMARVDGPRLEPLRRSLAARFRNSFVSVRSYRSTQDDIGEDLARAENYLSLVGLAVVVLGGIGVSSVTRVFIDQKLKSIAVLKCVGAGTRQVIAVYMLQVVLLGLVGSLGGLGLGRLALTLAPDEIGGGGASFRLSHALTPAAMAQAVGIGVLIAILFSLVPLLGIRHVRPSLLLREQVTGPGRRDVLRIAAMLGVVAAVVALAVWQAASWRIGVAVCGGFAVVAAVLHGCSVALVAGARRFGRSRSFAVRHAVRHLGRPGNQTRVVLLAVGLGAFFILGIRGVQANLLHELAFDVDARMPDMFLIDVQQDQVAGVTRLIASRTGYDADLLPVLRARVTQVKGRAVRLDDVEDVRGRGSLAREYTITYRSHLQPNEQVVAGRFWDARPSPVPEVSVEEGLHERFQIGVGDSIRFDVLGQPITARVTSIRRVNWRDARSGGFMFVFRPGVLENAPHGYIAPLRGPAGAADRARFQRDLVAAYPNVSVIDVREVLDSARRVVGNVTLGISVVGGLVLFTGVLILIGAVAMTKFRRVYETAILKTLGASARLIGGILLVEYGLLGAVAGVVGALGGAALSWALARWVLHIPWRFAGLETAAGILATIAIVSGVGLAASADVLGRKPLATLRAE